MKRLIDGLTYGFLSSLLFVFSVGSLAADVVRLRSGGYLEGRVEETEDGVRVYITGGSVEVRSDEIERIDRSPVPVDFFRKRLKEVRNDAEGSMSLARWALKKGLNAEYAEALRQVVALVPDHSEANKRLLDYYHRLEFLPYNDDAAEALRVEMGPGFYVHRTHHYRICGNGSAAYNEAVGLLLEEVYRQFIRFFQERRSYPMPLDDRLEVVVFASQAEFAAYAQSMGYSLDQVAGFYYSATQRSYFYDGFNSPTIALQLTQFADARQQVLEQKESIQRGAKGSDRYEVTYPDGTKEVLKAREAIAYLDQRLDELDKDALAFRQSLGDGNIGTTVHEGVHQLAFQCGIHNPYLDNPVWLMEGLATYFESPQEGEWTGPGQIHTQRLETFSAMVSDPGALRLESILIHDEVFAANSPRVHQAYALSWALFYYLVHTDQKSLFDYIRELGSMDRRGEYPPEKRLADFRRFFAEPKQVEQRCRLYFEGRW